MSYEDLKTVIETDRIIMYGDWAEGVIFDVLYGENADLESDFHEHFEIVNEPSYVMADPDEDFYQGVSFMSIIKRKSDGRLFGYEYWQPVAKHDSDAIVEENGDELGLQPEYVDEDHYCPIYVWRPIEPFTITGYRLVPQEEQQ